MQFLKPYNLQDAIKARTGTGYPILAGGTDLMAQWKSGAPKPEGVIDIWNISELKQIREADGKIEIGALATHTDIIKNKTVQKFVPALVEACKTIGAVQIQNRGTISGNVMNASPAGDTLPVLLAYDAEVELASLTGMRRVPFGEFFTGYRKTVARNDEIVTKFIVNKAGNNERAQFIKIGTRQAQAISKVNACFRYNPPIPPLKKGGQGGFVVAFGSVAPVPIRCYKTEEFLNDVLSSSRRALPTAELARRISEEISPIDDIRSSAEYRKHVCAVMLKRFLLTYYAQNIRVPGASCIHRA